MDCERSQELFEDLFLGAKPVTQISLEHGHHIEHCLECRAQWRILDTLSKHRNRTEITPDTRAVQLLHEEVWLTIKRSERKAPVANVRPRAQTILALCATVLLVVAATVFVAQRVLLRTAKNEYIQTTEVGKPKASPEPESRALVRTNPQHALELLRLQYEQAEGASCAAEFSRIVDCATQLIADWPASKEAILARKLISLCYTALADHDNARATFIRFAEESGDRASENVIRNQGRKSHAARAKADESARILCEEADRLSLSNDYQMALPYYDELIGKFPDSRYAVLARIKYANYLEKVGHNSESVLYLENVVSKSAWAQPVRDAYVTIARISLNTGNHDKAIWCWQRIATEATSNAERACAYYNLGVIYETLKDYSSAINSWQTVLQRFSDHTNYVDAAQRGLTALRNTQLELAR